MRKHEGSHNKGVRKYVSLEPGLWSDIFAKEIAKKDDIPCSWVFKRNKCYLSGEKFRVFKGKCKSCSATLVGSLKKKPCEGEYVDITIRISDIDFGKHTKLAKKVKLTSQVVKKIYSQNKKVTVIRWNVLKNSTEMFSEPKSRTMTANAIRCGQYRNRMNDKISKCPNSALGYIKSSHLFMNCIQHIGFDPFYVFYSTPEQKKMFHAFNTRNKSFKVSCDANGNYGNYGNAYIKW